MRSLWIPLIASSSLALATTKANVVVINEIADKGTSNACNGADWIELYNPGLQEVDMGKEGYVMHDDKGINSEDTFTFPPGTMLGAQDYMVLCTEQSIPTEEDVGIDMIDPMSPQFGIKGSDVITLTRILQPPTGGEDNTTATTSQFGISTGRNGAVYEVVSSVALPNTDDAFDVSYAFDSESGVYNYTSTPTPGGPNIMTALLTQEERNEKFKAELKAQNALGTQFFNMDDRGFRVADGMDDVLELNFTMLEDDYQYLVQNKTYELYRPFQSAVLSTTAGDKLLDIPIGGRIRAKGQSSLFLATCMGADTFPMQVQFDDNATLFGVEKIYLRHHVGDYAFMRDWAYNRMLARFGLPHLRARKVRVWINGIKAGFYTLMEAPDQDYVFARSFPDFDPQAYALYKVKSFADDCGSYTLDEIALAEQRVDDTSTPPYAFQRGEHKPIVEELGLLAFDQCIENYDKELWKRDYIDVVVAWLRYDKDCADMLLDEKLVDLDLGQNEYKKEMRDFIRYDYSDEQVCDEGCQNTNLIDRVDQENWLKSFAFYAVTMNADSPLMNGNNFYLAMSGAEKYGGVGGWKIVPYDFNLAEVTYCHEQVCNERMVYWSIARPTCDSLEKNGLAGPLLTDETLHAKYLEYVREFVDTIYGNESFVEELQQHIEVQDPYVREDFWSFWGGFYNNELTPESAEWHDGERQFPLLPTMKARTEDIRAQFEAIDAGTFPRGPFVGVHGDNEPWEPCADWRMEEANRTACPEECYYTGCHMPDWTVPSYCDEATGKCLHGDYDERCNGVFDNNKYAGMEDTPDGRETFCRFTKGVPVAAVECPAVGAVPVAAEAAATTEESSASIVGLVVSVAVMALASVLSL